MSFVDTINREALKHLPKSKDIRKRYLVTEGELFFLYKEIQLLRSKEARELFMTDFKKLLNEAQEISVTIKEKDHAKK